MQLGARGSSILYSSGDGGVAGTHGADCDSGRPFVPVFPAGCPYITAVGATQLVSAGKEAGKETGALFSSGGFSTFFAQPSYQSQAVAAYLSNIGSVYHGRYNASGRGFPDVSANGVNFTIYTASGGGSGAPPGYQLVSGTSASSPTFASIIALINDRLIAAGDKPLGFLNPWLYSHADALTDITTGTFPLLLDRIIAPWLTPLPVRLQPGLR
jgi:tripeptidyl-peptidase I